MKKYIGLVKLFTIVLIVFSFQACSIKIPVELKDVKSSQYSYNKSKDEVKPILISFRNALPLNNKVVTGQFEEMFYLQQNKKDLDSYIFIKNALNNEFKARQLPISEGAESQNFLKIDKFEIYTYNTIAFAPIVYLSMLKVTVQIDGEEKSFSSIVKRAKVTALTRERFEDACYNEPIMIMIKEIVSKINREYFNYQLSDQYINELNNKVQKGIETKDELNYLNMYELGFSNNDKALDILINYSNNPDEYIRLASISMLGLIGGESQFEYLVSKYRNSKLWQDRALALKAISDINTQRAKKFVEQEYNLWKSQDTKEGKWHKMLIEVYK